MYTKHIITYKHIYYLSLMVSPRYGPDLTVTMSVMLIYRVYQRLTHHITNIPAAHRSPAPIYQHCTVNAYI